MKKPEEEEDHCQVHVGIRPPLTEPDSHLCGQSTTGNAMCAVGGLPQIPCQ